MPPRSAPPRAPLAPSSFTSRARRLLARTGSLGALALIALAGAACSSSPDSGSVEEAPSGVTSSKIINGKTSPSSQDAVIMLIHTDLKSYFASCSGTLIAPNLVLTARHCVSTTTDAAFGCDSNGNLAPGSTGGKVGSDFDPKDLYVFTGNKRPAFDQGKVNAQAHGQKIFHDDSKILCSHDLSLVLLDTSIDGAQILPVRLDGPPKDGELMTAVGWGVTTAESIPATRQQRTDIKVQHVGPYEKGFDQVGPNDFEVGESICSGDSGGPSISQDTNAVMGVVSRGGNGQSDPNNPAVGCTGADTMNDYTQTAPFKDLILQAYSEAGQDPWNEGGPDPRLAKLGGDCSADTDCQSNMCVDSKCSQDCSTDACPDGYTCQSDGDRKVCKSAPAKSGCAVAPMPGSGSERSNDGARTLGVALALGVGAIFARKRRRA